MNHNTTKTMVGMGILTAIVVVLQAFASAIKFGPFSITLVLAPIIIGAALYGILAGGWLGTVFGVMVLLSGDATTFMTINAPATIAVCILKGMLAGLAAGCVYRLLHEKSELAAVVTAGIVCPVVNTGVFILGSLMFFMGWLKDLGGALGYGNVGSTILFGIVGINFIIELSINLVLSTAIVRILTIVRNQNA